MAPRPGNTPRMHHSIFVFLFSPYWLHHQHLKIDVLNAIQMLPTNVVRMDCPDIEDRPNQKNLPEQARVLSFKSRMNYPNELISTRNHIYQTCPKSIDHRGHQILELQFLLQTEWIYSKPLRITFVMCGKQCTGRV